MISESPSRKESLRLEAHQATRDVGVLEFPDRVARGIRSAALRNGDGWRAGGAEGTIRAAIEPETLYYMVISGAPKLNPVARESAWALKMGAARC